MKKIKYLLLLCAVAIITTGCVKFNVNMDIKKDKSMEFSVLYAFDKSLMGEGNSLKEEDFVEAKEQGFEVVKYSQDNYEGFKLTKKIANIDEVSTESDVTYDISGLMEETEDNKYIFKVVKGTDKNTYIAKIKFDSNSGGMSTDIDDETEELETEDLTEETLGDENDLLTTTPDEENSLLTTTDDEMLTTTEDNSLDLTDGGSDYDFSGMMANLDLSFNVTLPYGAISSNATTKENDNKNLSWKLGTSGVQYIEFEFELNNNEGSDSNMLLYIGIGVAALLVVIVLVLVLGKKKNNPVVSNVSENVVTEPTTNNVSENVVPEQETKNE